MEQFKEEINLIALMKSDIEARPKSFLELKKSLYFKDWI